MKQATLAVRKWKTMGIYPITSLSSQVADERLQGPTIHVAYNQTQSSTCREAWTDICVLHCVCVSEREREREREPSQLITTVFNMVFSWYEC